MLVHYVSCPVEDPVDTEMDDGNPSVFREGWPGQLISSKPCPRVQGNKELGTGIHLPQGGL